MKRTKIAEGAGVFVTDDGQCVQVYRSRFDNRVWLRIEHQHGTDSIGYRRKSHRTLLALAAAIVKGVEDCTPARLSRRKP